MVHADALQASYSATGSRHLVLRGMSVALYRRRVTVFMGPSGSGKTTLFSVLGGLLTPDAGRVWIDGEDVYALSSDARATLRLRTVGFVFQSFRLISSLNSLDNVALPLRLRGLRASDAQHRARYALSCVGIEDLERYPSELSGGQRQRVAIARALAGDPIVILADEPTANLDRANGQAVAELLAEAAHERNVAVGLVTHDTRLTVIADEIHALEDGRLCQRAG